MRSFLLLWWILWARVDFLARWRGVLSDVPTSTALDRSLLLVLPAVLSRRRRLDKGKTGVEILKIQ